MPIDISLNATTGDHNLTLKWTFPSNQLHQNNYTLSYLDNTVQSSSNFEADKKSFNFTTSSNTYVFTSDISNDLKKLSNNMPYGLQLTTNDLSSHTLESNFVSAAPTTKNNDITLKLVPDDTKINLSWTFKSTSRPSPSRQYTLYYVEDVKTEKTFLTNVQEMTTFTDISNTVKYTFDMLTNNKSYGLYLTTEDISGNTIQSAINFATPTYSVKLTVKPGDRKIDLSWTLPKNFNNSNNYTLNYLPGIGELGSNQEGGLELYFNSTSSKYTFTKDISNGVANLLNSYPYGLYLTAYDISGVAYESNRISSAPVGKNNGILLTTANAEQSINMSWTFKTGISSVDDNYCINYIPGVSKLSDFISRDVLSYNFTDVGEPNTHIFSGPTIHNDVTTAFFLTTTDISGNLRQSELLFATPTNGIKLTAKPLNKKVNLSWTFNKGFITSNSYNIQYQPNVDSSQNFDDATGVSLLNNTTTSYNFGDLINNMSYGFRLVSRDSSLNTLWHSNDVFTTPVPEQNIKLTGTAGDKKISLKWTFSKTATTDRNYDIFDLSYNLLESFTDISNTKMYNLTDLSNNISYDLYLRTQDLSGDYISNKITVTPKPSETITLTGKAGVRKIDLSWTFKNKVITSDTNYHLYYAPNVKTAAQFNNGGPIFNINFTDISNKSYTFDKDINNIDLSGNVSYGMYLHTQDASNNEFISKTIFVTAKK